MYEIFFVPLLPTNVSYALRIMEDSEIHCILATRMGSVSVADMCHSLVLPDSVGRLYPFLFCTDSLVARNAAWVMTHFDADALLVLLPHCDDMIDLVMRTDNSGLRRLLLNILYRLPMDGEALRTDFLDFCLSGMVSMDQPPGVQSLCMKLAHRMCSFYPALSDEFVRTVMGMEMCYYTPAVRSVRNKVLRGVVRCME